MSHGNLDVLDLRVCMVFREVKRGNENGQNGLCQEIPHASCYVMSSLLATFRQIALVRFHSQVQY